MRVAEENATDRKPSYEQARDELTDVVKRLEAGGLTLEESLALWERGIKEWFEHKAEIIRTYPQHFAVEDEADVDFAVEFMEEHDFFTDTVYLDEDWVEAETGLYDLMKQTGWMAEDAEIPEFQVVEPAESE